MSGHKEHEYIKVEFADNGGFVLKWQTYTPAAKHSESRWDDHTKIFGEEQEEDMMETIKKLYRENMAWAKDYKDKAGSSYSNPGYNKTSM